MRGSSFIYMCPLVSSCLPCGFIVHITVSFYKAKLLLTAKEGSTIIALLFTLISLDFASNYKVNLCGLQNR